MDLATIDGLEIPSIDETDPAQVEAFFGNFGHWEHWRKVVLANCAELERAKAVGITPKVTEDRLKNLARIHPNYVQFLTDGLLGRILRERLVREHMGA